MKLYELIPKLEGKPNIVMKSSHIPTSPPRPKHPADPSGRSPAAVSVDRQYRVMPSDQTYQSYPASDQVVVEHKASGTLWACSYSVGEDDSDYACNAPWYQVEAVTKTITTYRRVR